MLKLLTAFFTLFVIVGHAKAEEIRITNHEGGSIIAEVRHWEEVAARGDKVVIDGLCQSACTVVLGIIPHSRLCITDRAVLSFHMGFVRPPGYRRPQGKGGFDENNRIPDKAMTARMTRYYPAPVKKWIAAHGGLTGLEFKKMPAREITFLKRCR